MKSHETSQDLNVSNILIGWSQMTKRFVYNHMTDDTTLTEPTTLQKGMCVLSLHLLQV